MEEYSRYLSPGLRLYAVYVLAHRVYLNGDYERALGMAQSALMLLPDSYPIAMIYLYCIVSMCQIRSEADGGIEGELHDRLEDGEGGRLPGTIH